MRILSLLLLLFFGFTLSGCGKGNQINGHNNRTAFRSAKILKQRMPPEKRIEFEISFWTIRDAFKDDDMFLDEVDGKTPEEIITVGHEIFQQRKSQGFKAYDKYQSWEDMIAQFTQERTEQDRRVKSTPEDRNREKANNVLYKL
ncbi:MAG: hypothetical protein ACU84J_02210 [Gammaproteobacteria bacterium]